MKSLIVFALALASLAEAGPIGAGTLNLTNAYRDGHPGDVSATATDASGSYAGQANCIDFGLITNLPAFLTGTFYDIANFNDAVRAKLFLDMIGQTGATANYALAIWEVGWAAQTPNNPVSDALLSGAQSYVSGLSDYSEFAGVTIFRPDQKSNQSFLFGSAGAGDIETPEPATLAMIGLGLAALGWRRRHA